MEFQKKKNLLDLEYNTFLNYFNIIALFIATTYIVILIGTLDKIDWSIFKIISTALFTLILILLFWFLFYAKLKSIKQEIKKL